MKRYTLLFLLMSFCLQAQTKLGKVTVAELAEKKYPADTSAAAAILMKKTDVRFTTDGAGYFVVCYETSMKIKIYKKEAYDLGNVAAGYYTGARGETVDFDDAATYNLVDGKVERTKVKGESEFTEKSADDYKTKKISFPNVKEGSIIEYTLKRTNYNVIGIRDFFFQGEYPVAYAEYRICTPDQCQYNRFMGGFLTPEQKVENITVQNTDRTETRVTYTMRNVPAMKDEDFVNNIDNYRSRMIYELGSWKHRDGSVERYATDWKSVTKNVYESDDFGDQLKKTGYFEQDLEVASAGASSREERIRKIFDFVQSRMVWNEHFGVYCSKGVKSAYKDKTGNVAEINLILTAMLRKADIKANPVLVSTRANGIALFPSRTAFNYVICAVDTENGPLLLDATSKNSGVNLLPIRALNWNGRLLRADGTSEEVELTPKTNSREAINMIASIDASGKVSGQIRDAYSDYFAFYFRERYGNMSKESYLEKLEKQYEGVQIDNYEGKNHKDKTQPFIETYNFTHDGMVDVIGDKMYFSPLLLFLRSENPFKQEKREYPVDFIFPKQERFSVNIKIPEGYAVESLPTAGNYTSMENMATFRYLVAATGNQIQLSVTHDVNTAIFTQDQYETLQMFYKEMISKQSEKIVLKKV